MPRTIIVAGQNETVRKKSEQTEVDLATIGLMSCVAIIIADKHGNASLTHVDDGTDLDFIQTELLAIPGSTLDIVKSADSTSDLDQKVCEKLHDLGLDSTPSSGAKRIRTVKDHTILLRDGKMLQPKMAYLTELLTVPLYGEGAISSDNPLKQDRAETCSNNPVHAQGDTYITQLNGLFVKRLPKIIYDGVNFFREPTKVLSETKKFFERYPLTQIRNIVMGLCGSAVVLNEQLIAIRSNSTNTGRLLYITDKLPLHIVQQKQIATYLNILENAWLSEIVKFEKQPTVLSDSNAGNISSTNAAFFTNTEKNNSKTITASNIKLPYNIGSA